MQAGPLEIALAVWALAVAGWDIWRLRVPNALLLIVAVPASLILIFGREGFFGSTIEQSLFGAGLGFVLPFSGYLQRQLGAGDVKYATLIGFLTGVAAEIKILLCAAVVLGILSLAALIESRRLGRPPRKLPAAVAISAGFLGFLMGAYGNGN